MGQAQPLLGLMKKGVVGVALEGPGFTETSRNTPPYKPWQDARIFNPS
jgi:hypothetical protein